MCWYSDYMKGGLDALKPRPRADKGGTRKITTEMEDVLLKKRSLYPKAPVTVIYDMLIKDELITAAEISLSTITRFYNRRDKMPGDENVKELKRFSHDLANQLWQTDLMYGPYIKVNGKKRQTYLMAYIDDATRLITHAGFYLSQDIMSLRHSFKEALLKRGIPRLLYTDNGKIYRCQAFEYLCANIGVTLLRAEPYTPNSKGKIERFFRSLRLRFLSTLNPDTVKSLDDLNNRLDHWLDTDYQKKPHSALMGKSPHESFIMQADRITLISDISIFNEKFLMKAERKIKHDATLSLNGNLYETNPSLAGVRVTVKYDPDDLINNSGAVFIYKDEKLLGTAKRVWFNDNARMKRASPSKKVTSRPHGEGLVLPEGPVNTISFKDMGV